MDKYYYILLSAGGLIYDVLYSPAPLPAEIELKGDTLKIANGKIENLALETRENTESHFFRLAQVLEEKFFIYIEFQA